MRLYPVGNNAHSKDDGSVTSTGSCEDKSSSKPLKSPKKKRVSRGSRVGMATRIAIDIVTGKELQSIYFDPTLAIGFNIPDDDWLGSHLFIPANIVSANEEQDYFTIKIPSGESFKIPRSSATYITENDDAGVDDILKLSKFSEMSLIHNLRMRYYRDQIYTFVGPILISINPYKWLANLYSEDTMAGYHARHQDYSAPHLFVVAEAAYSSLMLTSKGKRRDQSIIISGESGAGKTEATKVIMAYLARVTTIDHHHCPDSHKSIGQLEQRVLNTNPILEAFGNARTLRNDNSSRFGKFIKIQFESSGRIVGATIEKYLLEKTRVVHQSRGERNFHIFYQLLRGAPEELRSDLSLGHSTTAVDEFTYLQSSSHNSHIPNVLDESEFAIMRSCMSSVGITEAIQRDLFGLLVAVLHMGNVGFQEDDEGNVCGISEAGSGSFRAATRLLGVSEEELLTVISKKNMHVGGSVIVKSQTMQQAADKRDSIAKSVYSMLFTWLVDTVNSTIAPTAPTNWGYIGVLDIYGFENFDGVNGFEQLLINYANEKLQNHFNKHIFLMEQADYEIEGIDWSYINFNDNQMCVDLIEGRPEGKAGIFPTLDDAFSSGGRADANATFLAQLNQNWASGKHAHFLSPRFNLDQRFGIRHYAGDVYYEIDGFNEKNRDCMNSDMKQLLASSCIGLLKDMAAAVIGSDVAISTATSHQTPRKGKGPGQRMSERSASFINKLKEDSISKQFTCSLKELYDTLDATSPHYVRCIKPNVYKKSDQFDGFKILLQLQYAGMMETIRIRREGYALRELHHDFFVRYSPLEPNCRTLHELVAKLSEDLSVDSASWQVGTTKIFMRSEMSDKLERLLWLRLSSCARIIQKFWFHISACKAANKIKSLLRSYTSRKKYRAMLSSMVRIQSFYRMYTTRVHFANCIRAIALLQRVARGANARREYRRLKDPYEKMDYTSLASAISLTSKELDEALRRKEFHLCEGLQNKISHMESVLSRKSLPEIEPRSRKELNLYILEHEFMLDHMTTTGDFAGSKRVDERLERLLKLRSIFPTVAEIDNEIDAAQAQMNEAITKKDFKLCTSLQSTIDDLSQRRTAAVEREGPLLLSVEALNEKKVGLEQELARAMADKNFKACGDLQAQVDAIVADISSRQMTPSEAAAKLKTLQEEFDAASKANNFWEMANLTVKIEEHSALTGIAPTAADSSYYHELPVSELTNLKEMESKALQECINRKDFAGCEKHESSLKSINEALSAKESGQRDERSRDEIVAELERKKEELDTAFQARKYKLMESLDKEIEALEQTLENMPTAAMLSERISNLENELKIALKQKQYSVCEKIEEQLTELKKAYDIEKKRETNSRRASSMFCSPTKRPVAGAITTPIMATKSKPTVQRNTSKAKPKTKVTTRVTNTKQEKNRPVSKLRPKIPVTASDKSSILDVAEAMASKRMDAALLVNTRGELSGILTDNDVTRRVVSKGVDVASTGVRDVMTKNPKCVRSEDSALDALEMMVDNRFRHLPVLDKNGAVVGLLDIAKCLYDAVAALEKVQDGDSSGSSTDVLNGVLSDAMKKASGGRGSNQAQLMAMQAFMTQMFGGSVPTLRTVIGDSAYVSVSPSATCREAAKSMASIRKGVLVLDDSGDLVGIFTPKDLLNRVIAKGLDADSVAVSDVMTPNPDCVSPDMTLLDALREMYEQKYLHLPVRDESGRVLGMVDVMELVCHTAGGEDGNGKGWRDFFSNAMNARGDDASDTSSIPSARSKPVSTTRAAASQSSKDGQRPVSKLRPKIPVTASDKSSILVVAEAMASKRMDAALLVNTRGELSGILTDNDVTRRVVSKGVDVASTGVRDVMTKNPKCVRSEDSALDALEMMVDNRFRHLPVLDENGAVVGLLDIAKCLYDAVAALEKVQDGDSSGSSTDVLNGVLSDAMKKASGGRGSNQAQLMAMQALMTQMFGGSVPTLRTVIGDSAYVSVSPSATCREAAKSMASIRKGVLVLDDSGDLVGIFTPKDLLNRVIAKGLDADSVVVSDVMTPNPDCVSPDMTLLDALREMYEQKYLHLPVRDESGRVLGMVDVMELVCHTAGGEDGNGKGWRDFFSNAMNARGDDASDTSSIPSARSKPVSTTRAAASQSSKDGQRPVSKLRPKIPVTASDKSSILVVAEAMASKRMDAALLVNTRGELSGILTDNDVTRRVVSKGVDVASTGVRDVMTKNPKCVRSEDSALDALEMMVDNRFRHLPVLDKNGAVVGLLDIAKCLYDAVAALEKVQDGDSSGSSTDVLNGVLSDAMKKASGGRGSNQAQLMAMQALMTQMFGGSVPTLRTVIGDSAYVSVSPSATCREAAKSMASIRKGVLVLDDSGDLVGIFTPKDLLNRVIAKGLDADSVVVSDVMTPNPDCVSPDMTLLDALREMYEQKYLHLPVRDESGRVLGMVDVMELVCHTAGGEDGNGKGWRDFFSNAMNARGDDASDTSSIPSARSKPVSTTRAAASQSSKDGQRPVSKLRPKIPVTASDKSSILVVAEAMASKRMDAALLVNTRGELSGILTDNDVTRRVVSKGVDVASTGVRDVMTKNPKCVRSEDSALDALEMMVDNRFRHLPVLDKNGAVVGLLDIAKCLYDAVAALEKVQDGDSSGSSTDVLNGVLSDAMKKASGGRGSNQAQLMAMQALMTQMFGGSVPTLRTVIGDSAYVSVSPSATCREAAKSMASIRKGVLVLDDSGDLVGIFTPKDLLNRVIAKGLDADSVVVSDVMTPNPDCVSPDMTLLDALREMYEQKYLHLPVRDESGRVLGMVDVMELVCHTAGGEDGNGKGWRDFFSNAMNARGDDASDTSSIPSARSKPVSTTRAAASQSSKDGQRPVSKLRPKIPVTASDKSSILVVAEAMASKRMDAALLVNTRGELSGILTDNDVTRRVVSKGVDVASTGVRDVMTKNPKCVRSEDSALDALEMMVDNRFRHLPVLDKNGAVVGLLDIAKCLYDAVAALEKVQDGGSSGSSTDVLNGVLSDAMKKASGGRGSNQAQLMAMQALMTQMFGGSVPTLRTVIGDSAYVSVSPSATCREAAKSMASIRKGVLVLDDSGDLVGIFTPKDLLNRVIAKGLDADSVAVSDVMTPNPDCVSPDMTLLDALREMYEQKYLHLPVRDESGRVLGMVDVMELVCHTAGGEDGNGKGWRDFFSNAMNARGDDASDTSSIPSARSKPVSTTRAAASQSSKDGQRPVSKLRPKIPVTASDKSSILVVAEAMASKRMDAALLVNTRGELSGILTDNDVTRRVVSKGVDVASTGVRDVMTKNPKCVRSEDSALDALEMMVDNRFRHLPVLDKNGAVVGLLDIAKCLYDAVAALEKVQDGDSSGSSTDVLNGVLSDAMKKASGGRGSNQAQLMAMQALMTQMFGGSVPTLRTVIGDSAYVSVSPSATCREAAKSMASIRKGVLVLDDSGDLVGIFTPKDLLNRVIAKGLDADSVVVSDVMTPNPDCVSPDMTLLDALREMYEQKYLHLPVRDESGRVLGMVDVMELVCHTAGGEDGNGKGWRDFFSNAMNARGDDASDTSSYYGGRRESRSSQRQSLGGGASCRGSVSSTSKAAQRPVSNLRPKIPVTASDKSSILDVAEAMASKRMDAALLVNTRGELSGIFTDNDVTRRVVSKGVDVASTGVRDVMTKNPKCVRSEDSALDALEMMVDNRFRHLPVLDKNGAVVGLLDIAKCLYDAVAALEKVQDGDSSESSTDVLNGVLSDAMKKASGGRGSNQAQLMAMQALMTQMFGGSIPTLRSVIGDSALFWPLNKFSPHVSVTPSSTVREAAESMSSIRKGVLVLDEDGELVGVFTPKDLLNRVVAKHLDPDTVLVSEVMTPNPDCMFADQTVLDALREMHEQKYLHLPVREENGRVLGLVDVMELISHSAGGTDGSSKGWRNFFKTAMNARGDNMSDTSSVHSVPTSTKSLTRRGCSVKAPANKVSNKNHRPVSKLRPKNPVTLSDQSKILDVIDAMASKRLDAALLVNTHGELSGILTDNDVMKRIVARFIDIQSDVSDVMTKNPKCVRSEDSALDALEMMVDNRFRHLPVLDKNGAVVGLLDIAKCLYDAVAALEKVQDGDSSGSSTDVLNGVLSDAMKKASGGRGSNQAQLMAMQALMTQMFGGIMPTLRTVISDSSLLKVRPSTNVREAACLMAKDSRAMLVMEDDELLGVFTPKDLLNRVIAKKKSPDLTAISSVMTPNPDCVSPDMTLLDALREMRDQKYLHLPVRDESGRVLGMVDVMELVCHTAGGEDGNGKGWRDFFSNAMNARGDDASDAASVDTQQSSHVKTSVTMSPVIRAPYVPVNDDSYSDVFSITDLRIQRSQASTTALSAAGNHDTASVLESRVFVFKVMDFEGNVHRIKCTTESADEFKTTVAFHLSTESRLLVLKYVDDDNDEVVISSDESLAAAIDYAKMCGMNSLKIKAFISPSSLSAAEATPTNEASDIDDVAQGVPTPVVAHEVTDSSPVEESIGSSQPLSVTESKDEVVPKKMGTGVKLAMVAGAVAIVAAIGIVVTRQKGK